MENIKGISALPTAGEALREWVLNLNWVLSGDSWCDANGIHATDILVTTPTTKSLSKDLLSALTTAATKHSSANHQRAARALLEDAVGEADGNLLIKKGKGFELFQLRIKTGFNRGLGTEAITHLNEYIAAIHASSESIGAYFKRKAQLYTQICLTEGCELGPTARTVFLLDGLQRGAYQEVLKTWVKRILLGQGKLSLTSSTKDLHQAATDLLATSVYYKGNILQPGKSTNPNPSARAASTSATPTDSSTPSKNPMIESIVTRIRQGFAMNQSQTKWIRETFQCLHCFSSHHITKRCHQLRDKYCIRAKGKSDTQSTTGGTADAKKANTSPKESTDDPPPSTEAAKAASAAPPVAEATGEDTNSEAYESDSGFIPLDYDSDTELLSDFARQARVAAKAQAKHQEKARVAETRTVAKLGRRGPAWVNPNSGIKAVKWQDGVATDLAKLAEANQYYSPPADAIRTLCPDSGATSIMSPYRDMFKDFVDLSTQGRVVRLGDDNKTIPILGQGTLCLTVQGKTLALANTLYVPDLSAILLSSRVLRRMAPGCALVADHDGCFLTFPSFTFEIDDARDCTLPCTRVPSDTRLFDFDSRLHLSQHASTQERDYRQALQAIRTCTMHGWQVCASRKHIWIPTISGLRMVRSPGLIQRILLPRTYRLPKRTPPWPRRPPSGRCTPCPTLQRRRKNECQATI
jgi:hypothetical protein